ncbi:hypothetical protein TCDM_13484 [Trypanosoma cruzi Dm28c]|uniref:Uncharacterized protein n=1 Tax=Trypanosoma cruzi Dm28c TaxID=1416333 RepID=V5AIL3_TRYCR|nr:hypothetical protein TCDM_13484 [Trypanosoma cruzi Dm28c]
MPRHLNAVCMATPRYVSSGSLASVVSVGNVSRHHEEGSSPGIAEEYSPLQITVPSSLTSTAESVTGRLSIGRFADPSWILRLRANHWNTDPTCSVWQERPLRRTSGDIHSCSVRSTSSAAVRSSNSSTSASAPPSPVHPHAAQVSRCGQRQLRAVAGATNRCHPLILRVALRPVRLQRPPVTIAILQLHAINVVAVSGPLRSHHGSRRVHHHRQRSATDSAMPALATPVEQCPARTVNQLQTLSVANGGAIKGPSSGCTSRRSACGLKAAGTTSFSRMIPCAEDTTSPHTRNFHSINSLRVTSLRSNASWHHPGPLWIR